MHGLPTEVLVGLVLWVAASSAALGVAFAAITLLACHLSGERFALMIGSTSALVVAYILASRDDMLLEGLLAWRLAVFVSALGAGYLALGVVIQRRLPIATLKQAVIVGGFGAAAFSVVGVAALGLVVFVSLALG